MFRTGEGEGIETIDLKYGKTSFAIEYDDPRSEVLHGVEQGKPLSDAELGERLDRPIASPPIEEIVSAGDSVLIVVPDATRQTGAGQVVNLLVRRLIANGTEPFDIRVIFATGIHRKVTDAEKAAILTPFILQRIKTLDHDPRDLMRLIDLGTTDSGIEISLDRALVEHDHVITVGGVAFHYFAGFTGGRKLICPGLASSRTVAATHKLAFDFDRMQRREGVDTGRLTGNAVHEAFVEVVKKRPPSFSVNTIVDDAGGIVEAFCGDWQASHLAACEHFAAGHTVAIEGKRPLVVASCGGHPHDINVIQAHKTLDAAARACEEGGTIVLIAECGEGTGREDLLAWFDSENSQTLARRLAEKYQVNGQTAWSLLDKAERFDIRILTNLDPETTQKMHLKPITPDEITRLIAQNASSYIIPTGAKLAVTIKG